MGAISFVNVTALGGVCPPNARPGASAAAMNPVTMINATPFAFGFDELFIVIDASSQRPTSGRTPTCLAGQVDNGVLVATSGALRKSQNGGGGVGERVTLERAPSARTWLVPG